MKQFLIIAICGLLVSCGSVRHVVSGEAVVTKGLGSGGDAHFLLPYAEIMLIHKKDTLRQMADSQGGFRFEQLRHPTYVLYGVHSVYGQGRQVAVNFSRKRIENGSSLCFFVPDVDSAMLFQRPPFDGPAKRLTDEELKVYPKRWREPWTMVGAVFDDRTARFGMAIRKTLPGATVYAVCKRDTLRTKTDRLGRYCFWNLRGPEIRIWAECDGYESRKPSRLVPERVGRDSMLAVISHFDISLRPKVRAGK